MSAFHHIHHLNLKVPNCPFEAAGSTGAVELDAYLMKPGEIVASGEIRMQAEALTDAFGWRDLSLQMAGRSGRASPASASMRRAWPCTPTCAEDCPMRRMVAPASCGPPVFPRRDDHAADCRGGRGSGGLDGAALKRLSASGGVQEHPKAGMNAAAPAINGVAA